MVCLHGFMDTWRTWELVLPMLEREHEVLAPTLPGHAGGSQLNPQTTVEAFIDAVEQWMDSAGVATAHLVGNSLGGYVALKLAARGRATSVVAFAPAGGWAPGDRSAVALLEAQRVLHAQAKAVAPRAQSSLGTLESRRAATRLITTQYEHIPVDLLVHQILGIAACAGAEASSLPRSRTAGRSTRNGSPARCGSSGEPQTRSSPGPAPLSATNS
jgi:pimeloyl-ACP methyl ester carboxylesterase